MGYLKGKDLLYKGHTLECYLNMCPNYIIFKTKKPFCITANGPDLTNWEVIRRDKPQGFEGW